MKKLAYLIILLMLFIFVGCEKSNFNKQEEIIIKRFEVVNRERISNSSLDIIYILKDTETGNQFLYIDGYESCAIIQIKSDN